MALYVYVFYDLNLLCEYENVKEKVDLTDTWKWWIRSSSYLYWCLFFLTVIYFHVWDENKVFLKWIRQHQYVTGSGFSWHFSYALLFSGLSVRDLILQFRHKALILFKLLLLERRIVFYRSPVQPLCAAILSLLSLHPAMIERGLQESACVKWVM
jgi:hypothetical protein